MTSARGGLRVLVCRVGGYACAVPVEHVAETMRPLPIEPLKGAPPFVLGLAMIRGAAVPVLDTRLLIGASTQTAVTRFVTVRAGSRLVALAVDAVIGTPTLERSELNRMPPLVQHAAGEVVDAVGILDAELLLLLSAARAAPDAVWAAMAGRVEPSGGDR